MEIIRNERTLTVRMQVDYLWEREAYNRSHPKQSHRKKIYQFTAQAQYPHKRHDALQRKVRPGHEQSGWHNLQTRCRPTSANNRGEEEAWNILQERFQHINPMSTSRIIYEATTKKLFDFKNVHECTSHYQASFDKVVGLLTDTSSYTRQSTEMYFQATMLMNIGTEYLALVSAIQKDWKDEKTNLEEAVLQIIKHFEFIEGNEKAKVMQTSTPSIHRAPKRSCTNSECVTKSLTTHYTDRCWIKNPEPRAKYALGRIRPCRSQKNLRGGSTTQDNLAQTEPTPERDS